jgi:mannose-6-phosphate isomerase
VKPEPFRIEPKFVERIWGMRSLALLFPEKTNLAQPVGEVWLTGVDCSIASGPFQGKTLGMAWSEMKTVWRGTQLGTVDHFPLLVKFIFPADKLSIQVHPDDVYASAYEQIAGARGKTEMWHAVSAEPGAQVLVGLKPGVDKSRFLQSLELNTLEGLFQAHSVHAGDTFYVPAGTPHTIGPGMVICEVQEYSDLTYRVYDYGRVDAHGKPRELHVKKAIEVIKFGERSGGKVPALPFPASAGFRRDLLAACPYFVTERWELSGPAEFHTNGEWFTILVLLSGRGEIEGDGKKVGYNRGQVWFVPACMESPTIIPSEPTTLLRAYVARIRDFKNELLDTGLDEKAIAQTVFE